MKYVVGWVFCLLAALPAPVQALAGSQKPAATFMRIYGLSTAPSGFTEFCARDRASCRQQLASAPRLQLDERHWRDLNEVNSIVNHTVAPRSDIDTYGVSEYWTLPKNVGDCEDYGLLKQAMLVDRGWPRGSLLMTVVRDEAGQGHAVLTVSTKAGDFVLDNRQDVILAWQTSPYEYVKRQSTFDPKVWMALEPIDRPAPAQLASQASPGHAIAVKR
jgi:predicted transglutaminase-like cysteine proteinase